MKLRIPVVLLCALLASCGGGGSAVQPGSTVSAPVDTGGTSITSTIVVPAPQPQSGARAPQYVSASTLGLKVTVTDIPPTGKTASFTAITSVYSLGVGSNQIVIPTPATATGHTEDLTYVAYNLAPVSNAIPSNAKALSWGLTTGFVVQPGQNTNNIVLSAVADTYTVALVQTGAFGMMSANPPALAGAQTSLGLGGNAVPNGTPLLFDGGLNNITTAAGGPWNIVGAVPTTATTAATGIPVTIAETAGVAGCSVGPAPHLQLSLNGGTPATTATIGKTSDSVSAVYDGNGGAGWYAVISAKAQTQTLTYTLSSLATTAVPTPANTTDWNCGAQTLSFSFPNETALFTIVQHIASQPYTITEPNTPNCTGLVNVYAGSSTAAPLITPGTPTSLGALGTQFTVQLIGAPAGYYACNIEIQDANAVAGVTGGAAFPGGTTYVQALLPSNETFIVVP